MNFQMTIFSLFFMHTQDAGLNIFSNLEREPVSATLHLVLRLRGGGGPPPVTVRKHFPETWIWDSINGKE